MGINHESEEGRREETRLLAARVEEAERERDAMRAGREEARREAREVRKRLGVVSRASRDFTKSARAAAAGQHDLENELRASLADAREARRESEASRARMEGLVDSLDAVVWEAEASADGGIGRFTFVGKRCEDILGYPRSLWFRSADFWMETVHPDDREKVRATYAEAIRESGESRVEFRAFTAEGKVVWLQNFTRPVEGENGTRLRGVMSDVSARKREEETRAYLARLIESTSDGVIGFDREFRVVSWNRGARNILGYEEAEVVGRSAFEVIPPEHHEIAEKNRARLARGEELHDHVARLTTKSGGFVYVSMSISPVPDGADNSGYVWVMQNITERKRHEANLAFLAEVSEDLARLTNIDETMDALGEKIAGYFGLSACAFAELENGAEIGVINHGWHRADMPSLLGTYRMKEFVTPEVLERCRAGEAVVIRDVFDDPMTDGEQYAALNIGSFVSMPLVRGGEWRFLLVVYRSEPYDWREDEIELLRETTARIWTRLERARAEEALRESEGRLNLALDASEMGTFLYHVEENRVEPDARILALFGLPEDGALDLAEALATMIHPDDRSKYAETFARATDPDGDGVLDEEIRVVHPDESLHWIAVTARTTFEGDPRRAVRMSGMAADVTERRRAEEAMRESEERLRLTLDAARMGNWDMNLETREATRSARHDRIFGHEEMLDEWSYEKFLEYVHEDDRSFVAGEFERARKTGENWEFECRIIRADGEERWIWALGSPSAGKERMFGLVTDITERRRAEEKVRRSEERFRLLFEQATDAVIVHDIEGNITQVNERASESLGYSREELLSMRVSDVEMNITPGGFADTWGKVSTMGGAVLVEGVHRRKDGTEFPVEVSVGRFEGEGEPSMLALARDMTARKRIEEEREAAHRREKRAREHLAFLAEASRSLANFLDLDDALAEVARLAVPRVAQWCVAAVLEESGHEHRLAISFRNDSGETTVRHDTRLDDDAPEPVRGVIASGESYLVERVDEAHIEDIATSEEHIERLRTFGLDSYALVPLRARGRTFGTITFACNDPEKRYDREILALLENFADRASLTLDNARLYGRQRHTAGVLQKSLLPHDLPDIPGLDLAARLRPLGEGIEMGGDFYDLFEAAEGRWSVVMGDVLGKGPEAAASTSLARHTLRSVARTEETPSRALESLNAEILDQQSEDGDRFCTVLFGNIVANGGADGEADGGAGFGIEFASGGHPLPVVLRSDGSVEEAGRHGTLLGVYEDPELFDAKIKLAPGDALVLYTDGVTEARKEGELFGEGRVMEAISSCTGCTAEETAARLEKRLEEFTGGELGDDAAILVVKATVDEATG